MDTIDSAAQEGGLRAAAHEYRNRGWVVIPIEPRGKKPLIKWKALRENRPTLEQIDAWWDQWPDANVAVMTGPESGIAVVDIDSAAGEKVLHQLVGDVETPTSVTAKGKHLVFQYPGTAVPNSVRVLSGVDVRGANGYVVLPPSVHPTGRRYRWDHANGRGLDCLLAPFPTALLELQSRRVSQRTMGSPVSPQSVATGDGLAQPFQLPDVIRDGARNDTLFRHGSSLRAQGLDQEQIRAALERINVTRCASPLDAAELDAIAKSAARYDPGNEHLTDLGNARRLVQQHGNQLRYVQECGSWYTWDGRVWALDRTGEVMRYAKATVRQMYIEATAIEDSGQRERLVRWALASESEHHLQAMIALASTEPGIATAVESLDRDPWLLNVLNGTIELRSGTLRKHNPEDLTTRLVSVEFDPTATAPMWEAFLSTVMGADAELISYVQRLAGYSLTGDVSEQVLLFLHGYGSNGKTTLLNTLLELLGPYAKQADPQLLMARSNDTHPTNMADLRGSRLVVCCEVDEGRPLAEATVKQLTGSDRIKARFMRQDFFEFDPTHKIWLAANHKPVVRGTDHAMWRRIRLIPFMVTISEAQQDRQLSAKLRTELPGILAWAVQGCLAWLRDGLAAPDGVLMATAEYRSEMDLVAQFVDERCHEDQAAEVYAKALYAAYRDWCEEAGLEHPCVKQAFGRRMAERGYGKRKAAGGQLVYQGVELQ